MSTLTMEKKLTLKDFVANINEYKSVPGVKKYNRKIYDDRYRVKNPGKSNEWKKKDPKKAKIVRDKWYAAHPWYKAYSHSKTRCLYDRACWQNKRGLPHTARPEDFRLAWIESKADQMESPSVDRIEGHLGYIPGNIRFMELDENKSQRRSRYWYQDTKGHGRDI